MDKRLPAIALLGVVFFGTLGLARSWTLALEFSGAWLAGCAAIWWAKDLDGL